MFKNGIFTIEFEKEFNNETETPLYFITKNIKNLEIIEGRDLFGESFLKGVEFNLDEKKFFIPTMPIRDEGMLDREDFINILYDSMNVETEVVGTYQNSFYRQEPLHKIKKITISERKLTNNIKKRIKWLKQKNGRYSF